MVKTTRAGSIQWLKILKDGFGPSFWVFFAIAVVTGAACYFWQGAEVFNKSLAEDAVLLGNTVPRILAAISVAGIIWVILPRDKLTKYIGRDQGIMSLVVTMFASILTPGGPSAAFSLLAILGSAGADRGVLVTYITGWSMLGIQRILIWDMPFMGADFSIIRFLVSLPLPIIAGMIARKIPMGLELVSPAGGK